MCLCIISDRHAGILATIEESDWQPPYAHHRLCLRHLLSNFHRVMDGLKAIGTAKREAFFWIDEVRDTSKWSLCHDGGHRYGVTNTNLVEVFNLVIKGVCSLPLTTLVEFSFYRVNDYFVKRHEHASAWLLGGHM